MCRRHVGGKLWKLIEKIRPQLPAFQTIVVVLVKSRETVKFGAGVPFIRLPWVSRPSKLKVLAKCANESVSNVLAGEEYSFPEARPYPVGIKLNTIQLLLCRPTVDELWTLKLQRSICLPWSHETRYINDTWLASLDLLYVSTVSLKHERS